MNQKTGVNIIGYINKKFGLGQAVRANISAIKTINVSLTVNNFKLNENEVEEILIESELNNPNPVNIIQINFDKLPDLIRQKEKSYFEKKYNIGFWVWETENFPELAKVYFDFFDEIWTPSNFCVESISKKVKIPVFKVPHPVEFEYEKYTKEVKNEKFRFLTMFDYNSSINRKNPFGVIEAFENVFGKNNTNVELIIKTSLSNGFENQKNKIIEFTKSNQSIKVIEELLSQDELYSLIGSCDCFISLHKSEGFGLTMAEAMLLKKPVIATAYSGNTDFMNINNSLLVKYDFEKIGKNYYFNEEEDYWAKPDLIDASKKIKWVYENQKEAEQIGLVAHKYIKEKFNYNNIGDLISKRLKIIEPLILAKENLELDINYLKFENDLLEEKVSKLVNLSCVKFKVKFKNMMNKLTGKNRKYIWEK